MPIMSHAEWIRRTGGNRSRLLRAVDDALKEYHDPDEDGTEVRKKQKLKRAFENWLNSKTDPPNRDPVAIKEMQESLEPYRPFTPSWKATPIPKPKKPNDTSIYLAPSFENANSLERDQSTKAFAAARQLINTTYLRLNQAKNAGKDRDIYEEWFGTYDSTRYQKVLKNVRDIFDALYSRPIVLYYRGDSAAGPSDCPADTSSGPQNFFGATWRREILEKLTALDNGYTYVFLGKAFYRTATEFQDSMAGVLIHELSHAICNTTDVVYQFDPCHQLALSRPEDAIKNADSYEYLCEAYWRKLWTPTKPDLDDLPPKAHIKISMRAPG